MLLVGLTGGIGSGKTTAAGRFSQLGAYIIDADKLAHAVMLPNTPAWYEITACFGAQILNPNKEINRKFLADIVFADKTLLNKLNKIVHPQVFLEEKKQITQIIQNNSNAIIILDIPLLIETGHHKQMDRVIVVSVSQEKQTQRLLANGLTYKQIKTRLSAQLPLEEKIKHADFIIDNNGSLNQTYRQVEDIFRELVRIVDADL